MACVKHLAKIAKRQKAKRDRELDLLRAAMRYCDHVGQVPHGSVTVEGYVVLHRG